jgi:hypothetical protein
MFNNAQEIRNAVDTGKKVYWHHEGYEVIKDNLNQYMIHYKPNNYYIDLTHSDNETLNGELNGFYVA